MKPRERGGKGERVSEGDERMGGGGNGGENQRGAKRGGSGKKGREIYRLVDFWEWRDCACLHLELSALLI